VGDDFLSLFSFSLSLFFSLFSFLSPPLFLFFHPTTATTRRKSGKQRGGKKKERNQRSK